MANQITIREINYNGTQITVTADETGMLYVNGRCASTPIKMDGSAFVWGSVKDGLPANSKITLNSAQIFAIDQHAYDFRAAANARNSEIRRHDAIYNDGGYGYNPYA